MSAEATAFGVVGLGVMGSRIASRLLEFGKVTVYDADPGAVAASVDRGAYACSSPRELADRAETVFMSLPTPQIVQSVALGEDGLLGAGSMRTLVDLSTTGATVARRVAAEAAQRGVGYLDAPVSGGPAGASAGTLTVMVAGSAALFEHMEPTLRRLGSKILHVSERPGDGQLAKTINNLLSATAIAATAEALAFGVRAGMDATSLLDVINSSSGRSSASMDKFPAHVLTRTFDFGFRLPLMAKDVRLCLEEAAAQGTPMVIGGLIGQLWTLAATTNEPDADCTDIVRLFEQWAGATISAGPPITQGV